MITLSFRQTPQEFMVRIAATIVFKALRQARCAEVQLSDLTERPQYGYTASASSEPIGPKFVRITDLQDGKIDWERVPYCECSEPDNYRLQPNDLLFARTGATTGKTLLVADPEDAVFASYLIRVRPRQDIVPEYLYAFFQSDAYWAQIVEEKEGSAQPNCNGAKLATVMVPKVDTEMQMAVGRFLRFVRERQQDGHAPLPDLPAPLGHVKRVMEKVEELASKIDVARSLRNRSVAELTALELSFLEETFQPKRSWSVTRIRDFCEPPQYGYTASASLEPIGPQMVRITDIQEGRIDWNGVPYCECPEPEKYVLRQGDILFARTGATTGKSFLVRDCPSAVFASYLIRVRVRESVRSDFLYAFFQTPTYWSQISDQKAGTGQPNCNGEKLANLLVPIPPLPEQCRIVAYLDDIQAKVDALKSQQAQSTAQLDALLPSILDKAFKGEL